MEYTEEKIAQAKNYNSKIFAIYKMFSWDLLFYYSINFLFLTQVKALSAANVILLDGFYTLFKCLAQIPAVSLAEIVGKRRSLIIGNLFVTLSIFILLVCRNFTDAIIANALMGIGFSIKSLCEPIFLRDCMTVREHPGSTFARIDGKGSALSYGFDAISAATCGFLFVFNNYLPMFLCFAMCIISCIIAFNFKSYEDPSKKVKVKTFKNFENYFKDLKVAFKSIFASNRLKALFIFSGFFAGLLSMRASMASSLFHEIGIKEEYFGIIFSILTICSAISAKFQNVFHKKLKNKALTYFSLCFTTSMIAIGIIALFVHDFQFVVYSVLILYALQYIIRGSYYTLLKRYLNNFSSDTMSTKIYSANTLVESLFSVIICYITSLFLDVTSTAYTVMAIGCMFFVLFVVTLEYMKDRLGLKPEEYKKKDIYFTEVH